MGFLSALALSLISQSVGTQILAVIELSGRELAEEYLLLFGCPFVPAAPPAVWILQFIPIQTGSDSWPIRFQDLA